MKINKIIFILILPLVFTHVVKGQFVRHDDLSINVNVEVHSVNNGYQYNYVFTNSENSDQLLQSIRIEIGDKGDNKGGTISQITQIENLGNKWGGWTSNTKAQPINFKASSLITWVAEHDSVRNIEDLLSIPKSALAPTESVNLSFHSEGLPHIMRFWARGWSRPYKEAVYDSLRHIAGYSADEVAPPWYDDAFQGRTIAPVIPPDTLTNGDFLNQLNSHLSFSCDTTWITNRGICRSLEAKLENVAKQLGKDKIKQAINGLNAVLNEVAAQRGKHITEEGYALLYFNAEYLKEQLE